MSKEQPDFKLNRPGALIAALPAILGFIPEQSLVLVSVDGGELGSVLRVDLSDQLAETVGHLAEVASAAAPAAAIAVIVDADGARCPLCNEQHRRLCKALGAELNRFRIELWAAHVVDRVAPGGRWHCVDDCGAGGPVDDPSASPLAAAAVLDGRRLYRRRTDLQAVIAADESPRGAAVAAAIGERAAARMAAHRADPDGSTDRARRDIADVTAVAHALAAGQEPTDDELALAGCPLADVTVRDTLFGLAVGENAADAEALWALLSRTLPQPWRAEALVLLAFSAYARGDGPLAGVSLEAALRCAPAHRMAGMLDTALQSGLRPERIRELADSAYRLADRLGVRLPPRREFSRRAG
ncbi:MAG TPA: DUF4192 domain-containing protein [Mycobacterium sp.]|nr:DUF4192 domain-containing protein [Mycobacterium sp.]